MVTQSSSVVAASPDRSMCERRPLQRRGIIHGRTGRTVKRCKDGKHGGRRAFSVEKNEMFLQGCRSSLVCVFSNLASIYLIVWLCFFLFFFFVWLCPISACAWIITLFQGQPSSLRVMSCHSFCFSFFLSPLSSPPPLPPPPAPSLLATTSPGLQLPSFPARSP